MDGCRVTRESGYLSQTHNTIVTSKVVLSTVVLSKVVLSNDVISNVLLPKVVILTTLTHARSIATDKRATADYLQADSRWPPEN